MLRLVKLHALLDDIKMLSSGTKPELITQLRINQMNADFMEITSRVPWCIPIAAPNDNLRFNRSIKWMGKRMQLTERGHPQVPPF
jgi:hypothetical protein